MYGTIEEAYASYLEMARHLGRWFAERSATIKDSRFWNSPDQLDLREKEACLRGAEDALGLTEEEANASRRSAGLPERRVPVAK